MKTRKRKQNKVRINIWALGFKLKTESLGVTKQEEEKNRQIIIQSKVYRAAKKALKF
jgi:hypothetical protein